MFNLSTTDQKKIADIINGRNLPRKNLWIIIAVVNALKNQRQLTVTSKQVEQVINELGLRHRWRLDPEAKDGFGLQKAIGGLLGLHGLKLPHAGRGKDGFIFNIPRDGITEEYVRSIGLDPLDLEEQALVPEILDAVKNQLVILFKYHSDPEGAPYRRLCPHVYYKGKTMPMVAGVQTGGYSSSEAKANAVGKTTPTWRIFQADRMLDIKITVHHFHIDPAFKKSNYEGHRLYAMVERPVPEHARPDYTE